MPRVKQFDEAQAIQDFTEAFWKKGYANCSFADLTTASGLSRSSIYDTFGDKEQLFLRCLESYNEGTKQRLDAATSDKESALEKIATALMMPFEAAAGERCKGCLAVNTLAAVDGSNAEIQLTILKAKAGWEEFLKQCIREGQKNGEIHEKEKAGALARLVYSTFCGLLMLQKTMSDPSVLRSQVKTMLNLLRTSK